MIPFSDVTVPAVNYHGQRLSLRECAEAAALLHQSYLDEPMTHEDGDEYTMQAVVPQSTFPDPERAAMVAEELDRLNAVLRSRWRWLTERERDVMTLSIREPGRPLRELAAELGISFQAAGLHLNAARDVLCGGDLLRERVERARAASGRAPRTSESRRAYMKEYSRRRRAAARAARVRP